jgi:hypothetical protein
MSARRIARPDNFRGYGGGSVIHTRGPTAKESFKKAVVDGDILVEGRCGFYRLIFRCGRMPLCQPLGAGLANRFL